MAQQVIKKVWVTGDGAEYSTEQEALIAEAKAAAVRALNDSIIYWRGTSAEEVVDFLFSNGEVLSLLTRAVKLSK